MSAAERAGDAALVMVLNAGSSSLKHQLRSADGEVVARGALQRIGGGAADDPADHGAALDAVLAGYDADHPGVMDRVVVVGHRVVHGGTRFTGAVVVDDDVEAAIEALSALAPLHNPPQLAGVRAMRSRLPEVAQVAVFDTAFHTTIPEQAAVYAVPKEMTARGVRRYGFHGTSHQYVTRATADLLGVPVDQVRLVVCHVGNGVSVTAVRDGRSIDTSMGMTPLAGAVMGTRSGDVDPGLFAYLHREDGTGAEEVDAVLNSSSGMLGMCGASDLREVHEIAAGQRTVDGFGPEDARLALAVYAHRLRGYVAAYLGEVPGVHAVVFTGGVGENDAVVREMVTAPLAHLGVGSLVPVMVVPTDEEGEIARQALELLG